MGAKFIAVAFVVAAFIGFSEAGVCVQCNSLANPFCIRDPPVGLILPPTTCLNNVNNGCFTSINALGHTVRGCLYPDTRPGCDADPLCTPCPAVAGAGNGCNNQRFPVERRTCHQCTGDLNSPCAPQIATPADVCEVFGATERCFIHRNATGVTRGCEMTRGTLCATEALCHFCGTNGCNAQPFNSENVPGSASMYGATVTLILAAVAFVGASA